MMTILIPDKVYFPQRSFFPPYLSIRDHFRKKEKNNVRLGRQGKDCVMQSPEHSTANAVRTSEQLWVPAIPTEKGE